LVYGWLLTLRYPAFRWLVSTGWLPHTPHLRSVAQRQRTFTLFGWILVVYTTPTCVAVPYVFPYTFCLPLHLFFFHYRPLALALYRVCWPPPPHVLHLPSVGHRRSLPCVCSSCSVRWFSYLRYCGRVDYLWGTCCFTLGLGPLRFARDLAGSPCWFIRLRYHVIGWTLRSFHGGRCDTGWTTRLDLTLWVGLHTTRALPHFFNRQPLLRAVYHVAPPRDTSRALDARVTRLLVPFGVVPPHVLAFTCVMLQAFYLQGLPVTPFVTHFPTPHLPSLVWTLRLLYHITFGWLLYGLPFPTQVAPPAHATPHRTAFVALRATCRYRLIWFRFAGLRSRFTAPRTFYVCVTAFGYVDFGCAILHDIDIGFTLPWTILPVAFALGL